VRVLVTGSAGFIGHHLVTRLVEDGHEVVGFDSLNEYYDPKLKLDRLELQKAFPNFSFVLGSLEEAEVLADLVRESRPDIVYHLAAQAGVRYSLESPSSYVSANLVGTANLLEALRQTGAGHLVMASTSSVYGANPKMPFSERDGTDLPQSLYAATKRGTEAMAHSYSHLFDIPTTAVRFFTVYGPFGRPDMALFKFVKAIKAGAPIDVYGHGTLARDFTYVDDLVEALIGLGKAVPEKGISVSEADTISPVAPFRIVNIASGNPIGLMDFITEIEDCLGVEAVKNMLPMQPGDVVRTEADPRLLKDLLGYIPETSLSVGVRSFVDWYTKYYSS
jgi:UDP-glucuronate 4-epimerase